MLKGKKSLLKKAPKRKMSKKMHVMRGKKSSEDFQTRQSSDDCEDDEDWLDSYGDGCASYDRDPGWCADAGLYADEEGNDAVAKCCVCKMLSSSSDSCTIEEDTEWADVYGDSCAEYELNPWWCQTATDYADDNGDSAIDKCCICQSFESMPGFNVTYGYGYGGYGDGGWRW